MKEIKYPKTLHFSWSENLQNDDRMLEDDDVFVGKTVVVTEKLDGENTGMTSEVCHARSLDSRDHASRHWVKGLHGQIRSEIPYGWKIFGENVFAKHSIFYTELDSYFYVFSVWTEENRCLSWSDTEDFAEMLGLRVVPVLYCGPWNEEAIKSCWTGVSKFGSEQEGYVVRNFESFHYDDFERNVAKFVRKNHIQTSDHWMTQAIQPNLLKKESEDGDGEKSEGNPKEQ